MKDRKELRDFITQRWAELKIERDPYVDQWLAISRFITPASGRFLSEGADAEHSQNLARNRWNRIYNNTATRAANILAAGLMSGMTDPASQWFALTTGDPNLDSSHAVKQWLDMVQRILEMSFTRTNTYQALHHGWREVGTMGVMAIAVIEEPMNGFYCVPLVAGEYCIGVNFKGEPDTLYRRFSMTAGQLIRKYGRDAVGRTVCMCYDQKKVDKRFRCIHAIEPRPDRDPSKIDNLNMPWRSVVVLLDRDDANDGILEESGYNEFPAVVGRWGASGSDTYSEEAPGMVALGDVKQLQHQELQKGNAIDYQVDPPKILPTSAKDKLLDFLPGGKSFIDLPNGAHQVQSAFNVNLNLQHLTADMQEVQQRINQAFNVDLFLMLSGSTKNMTATEVAERHEEKLMMLGPVLSRLNHEVLRPLIERAFNILQRAGQIPPPPPELVGQQLNIEYTSMLARSQRAIRANGLTQFLGMVGQIAQFKPEVLLKINAFNAVNEYADYYSVAPSVVVPDDEAQAQLQAQQQAAQQQAQVEQAQQGADALSKLGGIPANDSTMAGKAIDAIGAMAQQA